MIDALYGLPTVRNLEHILQNLPNGISELVVHVADDRDGIPLPDGIEEKGASNRPFERDLITNGTIRRVLGQEDIELARYADIRVA